MASVGRTFLSLKMMEPQSSITGDVIKEVSDNLLTCTVPQVAANLSPSQQQPAPPATTPLVDQPAVKKVFTTVSAYDPVNKLLVFATVSNRL